MLGRYSAVADHTSDLAPFGPGNVYPAMDFVIDFVPPARLVYNGSNTPELFQLNICLRTYKDSALVRAPAGHAINPHIYVFLEPEVYFTIQQQSVLVNECYVIGVKHQPQTKSRALLNPYYNLEGFSVANSSPNYRSGIIVHASDNLKDPFRSQCPPDALTRHSVKDVLQI